MNLADYVEKATEKGASLVGAMGEVACDEFGQLSEDVAKYIGEEILDGRNGVTCRCTKDGLKFYGQGAAAFVDLVGALMKGCIDTEMTKLKYITLKSQPARERQLSKVVGAVMWPLMEVLVGKKGKHQLDVEYRVKGKDLVSYKYSGTDGPYAMLTERFRASPVGWVKMLPVPSGEKVVGILVGKRSERKRKRAGEVPVEALTVEEALKRWIAKYNDERDSRFDIWERWKETEELLEDESKQLAKFKVCYKEVKKERDALRNEVTRLRGQLALAERKVSSVKLMS